MEIVSPDSVPFLSVRTGNHETGVERNDTLLVESFWIHRSSVFLFSFT